MSRGGAEGKLYVHQKDLLHIEFGVGVAVGEASGFLAENGIAMVVWLFCFFLNSEDGAVLSRLNPYLGCGVFAEHQFMIGKKNDDFLFGSVMPMDPVAGVGVKLSRVNFAVIPNF